MKTSSRLRYFLYLSILIVGCTTGKNALQKGNYDASVQKSVDRLRNAPNNSEAKQVLAAAYELALKDHLNKIEQAERSSELLRWEYILTDYQQLNALASEINSCAACRLIVPSPRQFGAEIAEIELRAAETRYARGLRYLNENNRSSAKKAYHDFERAQQLYPGFKDVGQKLNDAYLAALVRVVVEPVGMDPRLYGLGNAYFQQQIDQFVANYSSNKFVAFYSMQQAAAKKIRPDQVLSLRFEDFVVGQTAIKERIEKMKKDSVIIDRGRNNKTVYGTVRAIFSVFDKKIASSGLLSMVISDWESKKIIRQQHISGTYVWQDSWASYKGDERALTRQQLKMLGRETLPPPPETFLAALSRPIYAQVVDEVNFFYGDY